MTRDRIDVWDVLPQCDHVSHGCGRWGEEGWVGPWEGLMPIISKNDP